MDYLAYFVERLDYIMFEKKLTPQLIAKHTGLNMGTINRWLNKSRMPNASSLILLSQYFECTVDYLTGRTEDNHFSPSIERQPIHIRLKQIIQQCQKNLKTIIKDTKISRTSLYYYLEGTHQPFLDNLIKLADYFDCSLDYLLGISI